MATSEARANPKLRNSLLISLLAGNLGVETGSTMTASATNIFSISPATCCNRNTVRESENRKRHGKADHYRRLRFKNLLSDQSSLSPAGGHRRGGPPIYRRH